MKNKNAKYIVGKIVQTNTNAYFHGSEQAIVKNKVTQPEFKEEVKCKEKTNQQKLQIKKQTRIFEKVTVAKDQSDAIHKHQDTASECEQSCVFLQRRCRLHIQQVPLGLEGIAGNTLAGHQLLNFVTGHLKLLKSHDQNYRKFVAFLMKSFYGHLFKVVTEIEEKISGHFLALGL